MAAPPMISVLTVNYYSAADVAGLAKSIAEAASGEAVELMVTNNSPEDALSTTTAAGHLTIRVLTPGWNTGFATGINHALQMARGDLVFVVNPDVRVEPGAFQIAADYLANHASVAVLLPRLLDADGQIQASVRRFYTWPVALYARSPLRLLPHRPAAFRRYLYDDLDRSGPAAVDWGLGGAMFVRRSDWTHGRLFDERFFMYFEDVDLCYHIWETNRQVVHHPGVVCRHLHRRQSANPFSLAGWRHLRSFARFVRKYGGLPQRPAHRASQAD